MSQKRDTIDRISIATPCSMSWEGMKGDDRTRYCDLCSLHVYNISEMSSREVKSLIATTEGRFCARLYRRTDGTVITRDCPVGLRAIRRHVSRVAGAVVTTVFSFCMAVMGQTPAQDDKSCPGRTKITIESTQDNRSLIQGVVLDGNGAVIGGGTVTLTNLETKQKIKTVCNDEGYFKFASVDVGSYELSIQAEGFESNVVKKFKVETSQALNVSIQMTFKGVMVTVGGAGPPLIDDSSVNGLKKTFTPQQSTSLPF